MRATDGYLYRNSDMLATSQGWTQDETGAQNPPETPLARPR
jgi:hypothetical protein